MGQSTWGVTAWRVTKQQQGGINQCDNEGRARLWSPSTPFCVFKCSATNSVWWSDKGYWKGNTRCCSAMTAGSVNTRLGLLANDLGLDPTANSGPQSSQQSSDFTAANNNGNNLSGRAQQQCCCEPLSSQCQEGLFGGGPDLIGSGLIDARKKPTTTTKRTIATRIVNRPSASEPQQSCPVGQKTCCYDGSIDLSVFGKQCLNPQQAQQSVPWTQGCQESQPQGVKQCGA